jgi:hypothetical protein
MAVCAVDYIELPRTVLRVKDVTDCECECDC